MQSLSWKNVLRSINDGQEPTPEQWQALSADERELIEMLRKEKLTTHALEFFDRIDEDKAWKKLYQKIPKQLPLRIRLLKYAAVFAGILILGTAALLFLRKNDSVQLQPVISGSYITEPVDHKRAILVLGNGETIDLNKNPNSRIQQDQVEIVNSDTSILKYSNAIGATKPAGYNTLIVPRGGQYKIELADGSEVWLNAETKLRYPAHFGGVAKRQLFLESGEAYFKVKRNTELPFVVNVGGMDVTVLGTEFNINTYTKNYATTLVTGSVRLNAGAAVTMLQPGQQSVYSNGGFRNRPVDVNTYTAWKDGQIVFEEAALEEVMNSVGRQYDFDIEFTSPELRKAVFGGSLRKTGQIEDVLTIIEKGGYMKFSIKGKTIVVSPVVQK